MISRNEFLTRNKIPLAWTGFGCLVLYSMLLNYEYWNLVEAFHAYFGYIAQCLALLKAWLSRLTEGIPVLNITLTVFWLVVFKRGFDQWNQR